MSEAPDAPWTLAGEVLVTVVHRPPGEASALPEGVAALPGPAVLWAAHWAQTPVGPFSELAVAVPARVGLRPGLCVTVAVVTSPEARVVGRLGWGFPRQLGDLRWSAEGDERTLRWWDRGVTVRGWAGRTGLPVAMALRAPQRRADGPVVVPGRFRGWGRRARVEVSVASPDDPLAPLAGRHRGLLVAGRQLILHPARRPQGVLGTLVAPLRAPEPGLAPTTAGPSAARVDAVRAYSSVG